MLNISNHPKWTDKQIMAAFVIDPRSQTAMDGAEEMLGREMQANDVQDLILYIPFPSILPTANLPEIEALVEALIDQYAVEILDHSTAMVQGEFVASVCFVKALQTRFHTTVYAATTERRVVESSDGIKTAVFEFIQFRQYPNLAPESGVGGIAEGGIFDGVDPYTDRPSL